MPQRAIYYPEHNLETYERNRAAGSFMLIPRTEVGLFDMDYFCPCGCGAEGTLLIGQFRKPGGKGPSWRWNGSRTEPTLEPSVNHVGHWHGWLRNGYWEAC